MNEAIAVHLSAALAALVVGPLAWLSRTRWPPWRRWHRGLGYVWASLMVLVACSALWIRDDQMVNIYGYTPIHLFVPMTVWSLWRGFTALARKDYLTHRRYMTGLYLYGCIVAGLLAFAPGRYLGQWIWS